MAQAVEMPVLGESVTEGTVTQWLKQVGDTVAVDEPLLEVSTDKVDTEVPSPVAGVLLRILVPEDETVDVGTVVCEIGDAAELGADAPAAPATPAAPAAPAEVPNPEIPSTVTASDEGAQVEWAYPTVPAVPPKAEDLDPAASGSGGGEAITMPVLGESVTEGTVTQWLKKVGDTVAVDEPLLEVSTDKVDTEVPSPVAGVITQIVVGEDETVEVGAVLAYVGGEGAPMAAPTPAVPAAPPVPAVPPVPAAPAAPAVPAPPAPPVPPVPRAAPVPPVPRAAPAPPVPASPTIPMVNNTGEYATPIVRQLAREKGVDLSQIQGTGVGGRIRKQDVLEAASSTAALPPAPPSAVPTPPAVPSPLRGSREEVPAVRADAAAKMVASLHATAQQSAVIEVDVTRIAALIARAKESFAAREGAPLSFLAFVVKAATEALKSHPALNASLEGSEIAYHGAENIGLVLESDEVAVIEGAGDLTIAGIAKQLVAPGLEAAPTFTIAQSGTAGILWETPIVRQPNAAALSVGEVTKRAAVFTDSEGNDTFAIRSVCYLSLSFDLRLVESGEAGRFLASLKSRLEAGDFAHELGL